MLQALRRLFHLDRADYARLDARRPGRPARRGVRARIGGMNGHRSLRQEVRGFAKALKNLNPAVRHDAREKLKALQVVCKLSPKPAAARLDRDISSILAKADLSSIDRVMKRSKGADRTALLQLRNEVLAIKASSRSDSVHKRATKAIARLEQLGAVPNFALEPALPPALSFTTPLFVAQPPPPVVTHRTPPPVIFERDAIPSPPPAPPPPAFGPAPRPILVHDGQLRRAARTVHFDPVMTPGFPAGASAAAHLSAAAPPAAPEHPVAPPPSVPSVIPRQPVAPAAARPPIVRGVKQKGPRTEWPIPKPSVITSLNANDGEGFAVTSTQARGSFGKIRLAIDSDGNVHAVKVIRLTRGYKSTSTAPMNRAEIKREYDYMARVGSPLTPTKLIRAGEKIYAVMPLMAGDIDKKLDACTDIAEKRAVGRSIALQAARGLRPLHAEHLVHRDLKPENLLFHGNGNVHISDFGIVEDVSDGPKQQYAGTPRFMAPEVMMGDLFDRSADIYSLGLTIADAIAPGMVNALTQGNELEQVQLRQEFEAWRAQLMQTTGGEPARVRDFIASSMSPFAHAFGRVAAVDPQLCAFILSRMLPMNPAERASVEQCEEFFARLQTPAQRDQASQFFARVAASDVRRAHILADLRAHRPAPRIAIEPPD